MILPQAHFDTGQLLAWAFGHDDLFIKRNQCLLSACNQNWVIGDPDRAKKVS